MAQKKDDGGKKRRLTFKRQGYLRTGGTLCPFCYSHNIVVEKANIEQHKCINEMICWSCDRKWKATYRLIDAER